MFSKQESHLKQVILTFIIWISILVIVLNFVGLNISKLLESNILLISIALICLLGSIIAHLLSWVILLRFFNEDISIKPLFSSIMIGFLAERILPHLLPTGELTMGYMANKKGVTDLDSSMASVTAQMFTWSIGFLFLTVIAFIWSILAIQIDTYIFILLIILLTFFLSLVGLLFYFILHTEKARGIFKYFALLGVKIGKKLRFFKEWSKEELIDRAMKEFDSFDKLVTPYLKEKKRLTVSSLYMFLHHLLTAGIFLFSVLGVGIDAPIPSILLFFIIARLIGLFSFMPGEIGAFEISSVVLVSTIAPLGLTVLAVSIYRIIQYWIPIFIGSLFAVDYETKKLAQKTVQSKKIKKSETE